jgi:REP element-mobilizing transposase RayT
MKFKTRYRIDSTRHRSWDYASPGWYFVTICTKHRENFFGDINCGEMCLSDAGRIVSEEWMKTEKIRSNIRLDEWFIIHNHIYGILVIVIRMIDVETRASLPLSIMY